MASKILVVDDELDIRHIFRQQFRREIKEHTYEFLFAGDGLEALEILKENLDIALVLSDINMPNMDGLALLREVKSGFPRTQIVMVTAYGDMKNIREAMNLGAFDFLNKPYTQRDLKITVANGIEQAKQLEFSRQAEHEKDQREFLEKLRHLTEDLSGTLDLKEVVSRFLSHIGHHLPYHRAMICLRNESAWDIPISQGFEDQILDGSVPVTICRELAATFDTLRVPVHPGLTEPYARLKPSLDRVCSGAWLGIPLFTRDVFNGMLILARNSDETYSDRELQIADTFCKQAALAIENARLFAEVNRLAITDSLTGLFNRRHFFFEGEKVLERARRYGRPLSLLMLDIDHFKRFNDEFGHAVGDRALVLLAGSIHKHCRKSDLPGRYGGEEMTLLMPETGLDEAERVAQRLRGTIMDTPITTKDYGDLNMTASLGVATLTESMTCLQDLVDSADQGLYRAKEAGRNKVIVVR